MRNEEVLGTLYVGVSEDFQRGIYPIARCLKASQHDLAIVLRSAGGYCDMQKDNLVTISKRPDRPINPLKGKTQYGWHFEQQIYDSDGIIRAEKAGGGSGNIPKVIERMSRDGDYKKGGNNMGKIGQISSEGSQCGSVFSDDGNMGTLTAGTHGYANPHICTRYRIRKLTPRECWRLMSFSDEDFDKAAEVNSNTQLYKQVGNSIVKNVLVAIFGQMIPGKEDVYKHTGQGKGEKE